MFGPLGLPEIMMIFVVALLLFGPRQLPKIGRTVGKALGEFRRASNDFKKTIEDEVAADEVREVERELKEVRQAGAEMLRESESVSSGGEPVTPKDA